LFINSSTNIYGVSGEEKNKNLHGTEYYPIKQYIQNRDTPPPATAAFVVVDLSKKPSPPL
jgi:hypothetical protein